MLKNEIADGDQSLVAGSASHKQEVEIPGALPVRLHTFDLARHVVIAPDGKRYVAATFADSLGSGYMTTLYPQQNGYLTLLCLAIRELRRETPDQAMQQHLSLVQIVQQGKLKKFLQENP